MPKTVGFGIAVLLVAAAAWLAGSANAKEKPAALDEGAREQLIFFAVLEGCYRDGVRNDAIDAMLVQHKKGLYANFVYGCPLCAPAVNALRVYRARPKFDWDKTDRTTFGKGLGSAQRKRLLGKDSKLRLQTVQALIRKWVGRKMKSLRLTPDEVRAWTILMEDGRKLGMSLLKSTNDVASEEVVQLGRCPTCDGSVEGTGK